MPTHYDILGVSQDATDQDIKKSYRKLSLQFHPDRNPDPSATEKYKEINESYEILSDQQKREQYNMELKFGGGGGGMGPMGGGGGMGPMGDMNDIFSMMFGGMGGFGGMPGMPGMHSSEGFPGIRVFHSTGGFPGGGGMEHMFQQMNKPPPIVKNIEITLEQAYTGGNIQIAIEKQVVQNMERINETEIMTIEIPAGIDENEVMVLREQGHVMNNNIKGDVKLTFKITNNSIFKRHGLDLIYNKTLSLKESLCGFSFEIVHLNGKSLNMNNTTNSAVIKPNYKKVIPGFGMNKNGQTGNLIIEMTIQFPDTLAKEQIEVLQTIL